jgi:hypothetical protein
MSCKRSEPLPAWTVLLALVLAAGCASGPGRVGRIDSLHVFSVPVALDLDGLPGPDGFGVTLYASKAAAARGVPITAGKIEIMMFDGAPQEDKKTNATPRRVWSYSSGELKNQVIRTSLGTGYRFAPRWGEVPPLQSRITIVARYLPPDGPAVQSAPTTIAVTSK